jgi:hypothetical protein
MKFESRFSNQSSLSLPQNNSSLQSHSRDQPLDYFNDSKNQSKPLENPEASQLKNRSNLKPSANWTFDDQQRLRDAKRDEWRKSLSEQVQEKERKKQEEKTRKLLEDKREEEKLSQERHLLEAKYKKEIQVELGLPYEEPRQAKTIKRPEPKPVKQEVHKESPVPVIKEIDPIVQNKEKFRSLEFNPMKIDYWKARSDLEIQQNSFKNILAKLKQDADQAHYERNEAIIELDRFREQLRMSSIDYDLKFQQKNVFSRNFSGNISNSFKNYENRMTDDYFVGSKPLSFESKFVPLVNAGHSVVNSGNGNSNNLTIARPDYSELGFNDVKEQLVEIDQILSSSYE